MSSPTYKDWIQARYPGGSSYPFAHNGDKNPVQRIKSSRQRFRDEKPTKERQDSWHSPYAGLVKGNASYLVYILTRMPWFAQENVHRTLSPTQKRNLERRKKRVQGLEFFSGISHFD